MQSVTHPAGWFEKLRSLRSAYVWRSVYQQRPTAAEGNLFRRQSFRYWHRGEGGLVSLDTHVAAIADMHRFATVDLATSTRTSADWTVIAMWGITPWGDILLLDRVRSRVDEGAHFDTLTPLRQRWLQPGDVVHVESRMFGTTLVYAAGRAGVPIAELHADSDKLTRALPAADLIRQGRVWFPADAPWLDEWCDELAAFPSGAHDDQVDTLAYAARVALAHWLPPEPPAARRSSALPAGDDLSTAFLAATGADRAPDLMTVDY